MRVIIWPFLMLAALIFMKMTTQRQCGHLDQYQCMCLYVWCGVCGARCVCVCDPEWSWKGHMAHRVGCVSRIAQLWCCVHLLFLKWLRRLSVQSSCYVIHHPVSVCCRSRTFIRIRSQLTMSATFLSTGPSSDSADD